MSSPSSVPFVLSPPACGLNRGLVHILVGVARSCTVVLFNASKIYISLLPLVIVIVLPPCHSKSIARTSCSRGRRSCTSPTFYPGECPGCGITDLPLNISFLNKENPLSLSLNLLVHRSTRTPSPCLQSVIEIDFNFDFLKTQCSYHLCIMMMMSDSLQVIDHKQNL